jgi:hypothetical protein
MTSEFAASVGRTEFDPSTPFVKVRINHMRLQGTDYAAGTFIDLKKVLIDPRLLWQLWDQRRVDMPTDAELTKLQKRK